MVCLFCRLRERVSESAVVPPSRPPGQQLHISISHSSLEMTEQPTGLFVFIFFRFGRIIFLETWSIYRLLILNRGKAGSIWQRWHRWWRLSQPFLHPTESGQSLHHLIQLRKWVNNPITSFTSSPRHTITWLLFPVKMTKAPAPRKWLQRPPAVKRSRNSQWQVPTDLQESWGLEEEVVPRLRAPWMAVPCADPPAVPSPGRVWRICSASTPRPTRAQCGWGQRTDGVWHTDTCGESFWFCW